MPVLAFHDIDNRIIPGITNFPPVRFANLLDFLISSGYRFYNLSDYIEVTNSSCNIALTFDDGFKNFLDSALPILAERKLPFSIFIPAGFVGKLNRWDYTYLISKREHLSAGELRGLAQAGAVIGSHGLSHQCLTDLSDRLLKIELENSKKRLEDMTGSDVAFLSYPFGRFNDKVEVYALDAGYARGFSLSSWRRSRVGFSLSRSPVYYFDTPFSVKSKIEGPLRPLENLKGRLLNAFSYGSIVYSRLLPRRWRTFE